ncbi:hypothetical protein ABT237_20950 [Streptomyces sp. NPDC001581]|uniref:hypothetical protein n=1 Tax=Streptomyces sp. NPDC001581 TaxID=3154386 RepID=UPI0033246C56
MCELGPGPPGGLGDVLGHRVVVVRLGEEVEGQEAVVNGRSRYVKVDEPRALLWGDERASLNEVRQNQLGQVAVRIDEGDWLASEVEREEK